MWLNDAQISKGAIATWRKSLLNTSPSHLVIDQLFQPDLLAQVCRILQQEQRWQSQQHTYAALYVNAATWQKTPTAQRFVQRDLWPRQPGIALEFLQFLRSAEFMALLSRIFSVQLTDQNVADPAINTNYFRLGSADFINQHADDSPGREICMLLYLNENWQEDFGGELVFQGNASQPLQITPQFNRCVLFDPASPGAEHWVNALTAAAAQRYRYNVTSWYWSE